MGHKVMLAIVGVALMASAFGQQKATSTEPTQGLGFQLTYGWYRNYSALSESSYFNIAFRGKDLYTTGIAPPAPSYYGRKSLLGLNYPLMFGVEKALTTVGGSFVTSRISQPITSGKKDDGDRLRLLFATDQVTDASRPGSFAAGLEYDLLRTGESFLHSKQADGESMLAVGALYQNRNDSTTSKQSSGVLSLRGRVGFAGLFEGTSALRQRAIDAIGDLTLNEFRNFASPKTHVEPGFRKVAGELLLSRFAAKFARIDFGNGEQADRMLESMVEKVTDEEFKQVRTDLIVELQKHAMEDAKQHPDRPRWSLYTDFEAYYDAQSDFTPNRYRAIYGVNLRFDLAPNEKNYRYLLVRYTNGFTQADPGNRQNGLVVTVGFGF